MNWKRRLAILAVPTILALGGGALVVHAASKSSPTPRSSQKETGTENQAGEVETANEAGDQGGAHADTGDQADHQSGAPHAGL